MDWYHRTTAGLPRIEPLTGVRWLAALAVCLSHSVPGGDTPTWLRTFFASGYMGVTVFFVLSGFILTVTYEASLSSPTGSRLGNYAVARFARVYPLYLLVLVWIMAQPSAAIPEGWWTHVVAVQTWSPDVSLAFALNNPGWSIGVEFFLYACFPLLLFLLRRPMRSITGSAAVVAIAALFIAGLLLWFTVTGRTDLAWADPGSAHRWIYRTPVTRLGDFTLGMGTAALFLLLRNRHEGARWAGWLAGGAFAIILVFMATPALLFTAASYDLLYAIPAAALMFGLALAPSRGLARIVGTVPLVALGEASYAFYLIHVPVGGLIGLDALANGITPLALVAYTLTLLMLVALSWGLHKIVEVPSRVGIRRYVHFPVKASSG